jgi:hypothetical protein
VTVRHLGWLVGPSLGDIASCPSKPGEPRHERGPRAIGGRRVQHPSHRVDAGAGGRLPAPHAAAAVQAPSRRHSRSRRAARRAGTAPRGRRATRADRQGRLTGAAGCSWMRQVTAAPAPSSRTDRSPARTPRLPGPGGRGGRNREPRRRRRPWSGSPGGPGVAPSSPSDLREAFALLRPRGVWCAAPLGNGPLEPIVTRGRA